MLAANPYWDNPRIFSPFWMEDVNIYHRYLNLFLDTEFPTPMPNFKFEALTSSSINSEQTHKKETL